MQKASTWQTLTFASPQTGLCVPGLKTQDPWQRQLQFSAADVSARSFEHHKFGLSFVQREEEPSALAAAQEPSYACSGLQISLAEGFQSWERVSECKLCTGWGQLHSYKGLNPHSRTQQWQKQASGTCWYGEIKFGLNSHPAVLFSHKQRREGRRRDEDWGRNNINKFCVLNWALKLTGFCSDPAFKMHSIKQNLRLPKNVRSSGSCQCFKLQLRYLVCKYGVI